MPGDLAQSVTAVPAAPWSAGASPRARKRRRRISLTALLLGVGLLWPLPVGAVLLMVAATLALVISWEEELDVAPQPARIDGVPAAPFTLEVAEIEVTDQLVGSAFSRPVVRRRG